MLLLVEPPECSIARNNWPVNPAGLIPPLPRKPPMLTEICWSKVGVWPPFWALLDRRHQNVLDPSPPINRLPFVSTSSVPVVGEWGRVIGFCQVTPPSVER